jgi:hypothetical protein
MSRSERSAFRWSSSGKARNGFGKGRGRKRNPRSSATDLGELSPERVGYCDSRNQSEDQYNSCVESPNFVQRDTGRIKPNSQCNPSDQPEQCRLGPKVAAGRFRAGRNRHNALALFNCDDFQVSQRTITGVPMQLQRLHYTAALFQCIRR